MLAKAHPVTAKMVVAAALNNDTLAQRVLAQAGRALGIGLANLVNLLNLLISLMGIAFFAALLYYSVKLVIGADWFSPILKVSTRVPYLSIPVNCALILLYLIRDAAMGLASMLKRSPGITEKA